MRHYVSSTTDSVAVIKNLSIRLAAEMVRSGRERAGNRRQFRDLVIRLAHQAFLTT